LFKDKAKQSFLVIKNGFFIIFFCSFSFFRWGNRESAQLKTLHDHFIYTEIPLSF